MRARHRQGVIRGYHVAILRDRSNTSGKSFNTTVNSSVLFVEIHGLDKYANYCITVVAFTVVGRGSRGNCVFVVTKEDGKYLDLVSFISFFNNKNNNNITIT